MSNQLNTLVAASNVLAPAYYVLKAQGYDVAFDAVREWWTATKGESKFLAYSTIELCGLIYIHEHKGDDWGVSDEAIKAYLLLDATDNTGADNSSF
ncbi:hypothetical protein ACFST9_07700 [Hymenobacter monticola]|uniref:DUF309 domain-containing protein n=1 Tax=Hymenobacter monticola TaxID=1705399 RepID=A0ABY4B3N3_9BACT|nr:hypothetical protein [Hymenobacter monticola]UOE33743.1 hypothetical protein MTP16_21800 [Hymenobacter monticola]